MSLFLLLITSILTNTSQSTENEGLNHWEFTSTVMNVDIKGNANDYQTEVISVYTIDTSKPQILFSCNERDGLVVKLRTRPLDSFSAEQLQSIQRRIKYRSVTRTVTFGGDDKKRLAFAYVKKSGSYSSAKHSTAAKFYNAVVKGISFELDDTLFVPASVDDDFRSFAKSCPSTNPATTK